MELPKNMVDIKLPSKKNKRKLNDRDESKTNTKLHMKNITINVKNKDKDNIPITFILTKQNCNETKTVKNKNKNKEKYSEGTSKSWLDITYDYNHVDSNNSKTSLICPALGYTCSLFSNFFDHHDEDIKNILINANNDILPSD